MLKLFLIFLVLVIIIIAFFVIETQDFDFVEFVIIMLIALQGLFLIISGNDLLINFLGIELQSLCFYILVGLRKHSNLGIEAAFKYFVLSAYSNLISLFGISFIYGFVGTTKLKEINILLDTESNTMLVLGVLFLFVGVFFKLAVFLFHY
jgi:NADH-quinone oxidoreductase subunit N